MDFKNLIAQRIAAHVDMEADKIEALIEIPPDKAMGDYAFPCFQLAKILRKAPPMIAADLAQKLDKGNEIDKVEAAGGYLNFFLNKGEYMKAILTDIRKAEGGYGASDMGSGKTVIVEYSSPNIAKPFHVGHLCTTVIGNSLEKIYRFLGYKTVRINHLGDWGTQFGKLISAFKRWGEEEALQADPIKELLRIYVKFHDEAKAQPELEVEARGYFKKLEDNDPEATALWKRFVDLSLQEFKKIYDLLHIEFDSYAGESFYSDKMDEIVSILEEKGLLEESENARVVNLEQFNMPPCIIRKSDGASIYATRDLAAALYRKRTYDFHKCIYVVGTPQALHFKQVFTTLQLAGFDWAKDCTHVGFGLVKFADKKLSTRSGDIILLEELLGESVKKTRQLMDTNNPNLEGKEEIAQMVGVGAVVYTFLKNNRERDIIFSWEDMLDFEGESGPYTQYTYVRGRSILRKAGEVPAEADYSLLSTEDEFALVRLMEDFKLAVLDAADKNEPSIVTRHIAALARAFNKFYNSHSILNAEEGLKNARLHLTEAVCAVIKTGIGLIGIEMPERM